MTRANKDEVIKRASLAFDKKDKAGNRQNRQLYKSICLNPHILPKGTNPTSPWAGIKDTRHLPETPPEIPSAHSAATEHAFRPRDDASFSFLSLYSRGGSSSNRNPKLRKVPIKISISVPPSAPTPISTPTLISAPITAMKDKYDADGRVKPPRTSFRGTASYADILKKRL